MTDQDLIAQFLADRKPVTCPEGRAYGADPAADRAERKAEVRQNWTRQARYDARHGTVNGYDVALDERMAMYRREQ